jgi:hypothetical protein
LNSEQKNVIKERVNNRLKIIEDELTRNPDEEAENEEKEENEIKEEKNEIIEKKEENKIKEEKEKEKIVTNVKQNEDKDDDIYPERVEKKYHVANKIKSLGCLEKEKELCDKIIEFKKKNGKDYETWEDKKDSIKEQNDLVMGFIQNQVWDFERYKKEIKDQYVWEKKLLQFADLDKSLNSEQKNVIKERVNNRIKIIEEELTRNPDEEAEAEDEEKQENEIKEGKEQNEIIEKKEENIIREEKEKEKKEVEQTNKDKGVDLYPEKVENKYHSVEKMNSLGVLQKETELFLVQMPL